ncbi:tryptophan--tRNA ligase [bacterium]|nr:tryptophan--tRNA ligase [bacterium]
MATSKKRILSGMRPTGKLHLGNFVGALENWVELQGEYDNFHLVADYHVLTTDSEHSDAILPNTLEMVRDWLAAGIDPAKSPMFRQSQIKEHAELHLLFSMLITKNRLERNPAVKEQVRDLGIEDLMTYGHLGYPVLQAADILLYKGNLVPVGEDQLPHVEITREIARKFNRHFGDVFPEPDGKVTKFARMPGPDGRRMSKSLGNTIFMSDTEEDTAKKVMSAITDPQKVRKNDPGRPEVCNVFTYHTKFNVAEVDEIATTCRSGELGCVACKKNCAAKMNAFMAPIRERRLQFGKDEDVLNILVDGEKRGRLVAQQTMSEVREAMKLG